MKDFKLGQTQPTQAVETIAHQLPSQPFNEEVVTKLLAQLAEAHPIQRRNAYEALLNRIRRQDLPLSALYQLQLANHCYFFWQQQRPHRVLQKPNNFWWW